MEYVNFYTPPFPYFIIAGSTLYRPGDLHGRRSNLGLFDLIFVNYGSLYLTDGDKSYLLRENELLILKPDSTHYAHKIVSEKTQFYWLHFRSASHHFYSEEVPFSRNNFKSLSSYLDRNDILTLPLYKKIGPSEEKGFRMILAGLLSTTINKYQQKTDRKQLSLSTLECQKNFLRLLEYLQEHRTQDDSCDVLAVRIMNYIQQNSDQPLTLEKIADYFNFHPVHIIRCMKKEFGITPNKALTQVRLNNACRFLATSEMSIHEIAIHVGFSTPSYFNKVFFKHMQMTPTEYRRNKAALMPER